MSCDAYLAYGRKCLEGIFWGGGFVRIMQDYKSVRMAVDLCHPG